MNTLFLSIRETAFAWETNLLIFMLIIIVVILLILLNVYELKRLSQIFFYCAQIIDLAIKSLLIRLRNICCYDADDDDVQCLKKYKSMCMTNDCLPYQIYNIIYNRILLALIFYITFLPIIDHG